MLPAGFLSMSATGLSVFVVEDEPMIRIVVTDMLAVPYHRSRGG